MIKQIQKWTIDCDFLPFFTFQTLEKATNVLVDSYGDTLYSIENTSYYPIAESYLTYERQREMPYQRCVNLDYVEVCLTELKDDLTKYGFKCIGYESGGQLWKKK